MSTNPKTDEEKTEDDLLNDKFVEGRTRIIDAYEELVAACHAFTDMMQWDYYKNEEYLLSRIFPKKKAQRRNADHIWEFFHSNKSEILSDLKMVESDRKRLEAGIQRRKQLMDQFNLTEDAVTELIRTLAEEEEPEA